jgi:hypothetical protein
LTDSVDVDFKQLGGGRSTIGGRTKANYSKLRVNGGRICVAVYLKQKSIVLDYLKGEQTTKSSVLVTYLFSVTGV